MSRQLMQYMDLPQQGGGAGKYHGDVATGYDAKREESPKWIIEQKIITDLLSDLPPKSIVLDCPVGTGRFLPFYCEKDFMFLGLDLSKDMMREAAKKIADDKRAIGELRVGDCRKLPVQDNSVDAVVNCRITRWLSPEDCQKMIRESQRVATKRVIWTARVSNHKFARSIELFEDALDGWEITKNIAGVDMDYRILMAEQMT